LEPKTNPPDIVYLGRLSPGKQPRDCFDAFRLIKKKAEVTMTVVGSGSMLHSLQKEYPDIRFLGFVPSTVKRQVLEKASVILASGTREGWNRGILEAQAYGVVPVVQNVHGLRDAVNGGRVGLLVPPRLPEVMAEAALSLLSDSSRLQELSKQAYAWASQFTYSRSTSQFESVLSGVVKS
jgi:glycosyltransferase involved in cell wall biosynthesis